jgi:RND family efflux transporter MFP subunit
MAAPSDIRTQLRSLAIPKAQRPVTSAGAPPARRRWILPAAGGALALVLAYGLYAGLAGSSPSLLPSAAAGAEVRLVPVTVRRGSDMPPLLTATGKVVSDHQVEVLTKVSGQIVALSFEQGDRVKKGQVLARIEDTIYRARRDQAAAELEKSRANLEYQKVNFDRVERLHQERNAPDIEYADARRWLDDAHAQVAANEAALQYAQKALNDCEVVAPIAGVVLERNVEVGDFVAAEGGRGANANAQFGAIADMAVLRVEVDISELDIARIRRGLPCTVTPDAYKDRRYSGHVMWIDPGANYSKATVQAKVRIEKPDEWLRVEGSAQVVFHADVPAPADNAADSLWIPSSACRPAPQGDTATVFVAVEGRLRQATITLGRRSGGEVEVRGGLTAGQSIAAEGLDKLRDGQRIKS